MTCTIAVTTGPDARHHATGLTATAVDAAGNTGTATVTFSVETTYLPDAIFRKDVFVVKRAKKYVVIAYAASLPRILLPASVPTTPTEKGPKMKRIGTSAGGLASTAPRWR